MEPNLNNPAGRLHAILFELKASTGHNQTANVWAKALKVDDINSSLPLLLVRLGKVYAMPGQIRAAMEELPGYHSYDVDSWHDPLARAFREAHLKSTWSQVVSHFSDNLLRGIESNSFKLSQYSGRPSLSDDQLKKLREEFIKLREVVSEADDVGPNSKERILERIQRVLGVIDNFWLEGTDNLIVEVQATVGEVATRPEAQESNASKTMVWIRKNGFIYAFRVLQIWNAINGQFPELHDFNGEDAQVALEEGNVADQDISEADYKDISEPETK